MFATLVGCFIALGVAGTTLFARQPALQTLWRLQPAEWGLCLVLLGLGGATSYPLNRWLLARIGSRAMVQRAGALQGVALALLPWWPAGAGSHHAPILAALFVQGVLSSGINVAINSQAALLESRSGRLRMGRLHALFYLGMTGAALLSSAMASAGLSARTHFGLVGLLLAAAYVVLAGGLDPARSVMPPRRLLHLPTPRVLALGLLAACASIAEGGINGWTPLYLHSVIGAPESAASLALACFSAAMFAGRLATDLNARLFGPRPLVRAGSLLGAAALTAAVLLPSQTTVLLALAIVGLGQAAIYPIVFSTAGRLGGDSISGVASLGSVGGLAGPALLGRVAAFGSLSAVFAAVAGTLVVVGWRAKALPRRV